MKTHFKNILVFFSSLNIYIRFAHLVGSSKNIIGGLLTNSRAIDNLFFCPPLKFDVIV